MRAILGLLLLSLVAAVDARGFRLPRTEGKYLTQEEHWLHQNLDHFSPTDHRQFKQRFYEFLDYYQGPGGPIFLKICGESACPGIPNDYTAVLAKKFGAALVSLEHRYYGKSSPFESLTTENLKYLSSKQALFDLAVFRQHYQDSLNAKYDLSKAENNWFIFGVSYSGALSAWFRLKFPHLACGSLASSGVVLAVYNFTEFDKQIGESAGAECKAVLQEITKLVEEQLQSNRRAVKNLFSAAMLKNDIDFLYLLADAAVIAIQYGNPDVLCTPLVDAKKAGKNLVEAYATYVKDYYIGSFGASVQTYDQQHLKNTTPGEDSADRLWWFQVCTEVAYFQVAPSNDSIRSSKIDTRYHLDLCKNVFGEGIYPDVDMTNLYYGGTKIAGSKIVFTNGSQDPWRHASKQTSSPDLPSYIIKCHNCGHGSDLRGCPQSPLNIEGNAENCTSPEAVQKVRQQMIEHIDLWLSQCRNTEGNATLLARACIVRYSSWDWNSTNLFAFPKYTIDDALYKTVCDREALTRIKTLVNKRNAPIAVEDCWKECLAIDFDTTSCQLCGNLNLHGCPNCSNRNHYSGTDDDVPGFFFPSRKMVSAS